MLAQRILKVPSLISLGALEFHCPNILTYLMNVSCMDSMKKVYCPLHLVVSYAPTHISPMHGETSHVQVKDPVCSIVTCTLLHGGSSCRFDSLYFNSRKCNIFVTKVSIYMYIYLTKKVCCYNYHYCYYYFVYYMSRAFFNF